MSSQENFIINKRESVIKYVTFISSIIVLYIGLFQSLFFMKSEHLTRIIYNDRFFFNYIFVAIFLISVCYFSFFMVKFFVYFFNTFISTKEYTAGQEIIFPDSDNVVSLNIFRYEKWMLEHRLLYAITRSKELNKLSKLFDRTIKKGIISVVALIVTTLVIFTTCIIGSFIVADQKNENPSANTNQQKQPIPAQQPKASLDDRSIMLRKSFDSVNTTAATVNPIVTRAEMNTPKSNQSKK